MKNVDINTFFVNDFFISPPKQFFPFQMFPIPPFLWTPLFGIPHHFKKYFASLPLDKAEEDRKLW